MSRPSSLACTTTAPAGPPAAQPEPPPQAAKGRGNPSLALVPRCGARTRAGCPCRAPAIHGKLRCRMHGGRSTGPRTPEGRARVAAARTTHGGYSADSRAFNRHHVTFLGRSSMRTLAMIHHESLPPELAARMAPIAPELLWPPRPTRGITRAEDRAMLRAETEALAPWKQAIALARQAKRPGRGGPAALGGALTAAQARPLAPEFVADAAGTASPASPAVPPAAQAEPHAPIRPAPTRAAARPAPGNTSSHVAAEPHAAIPPAPTRSAPGQAPASIRAKPPAEPLAPERAACGVRGTPAPARLAALPEAHAPERPAGAAAIAPAAAAGAPASTRAEPHAAIPPAPARSAPGLAPAGTRAKPPAKPHAPERPGRGGSGAPVPARLTTQPKAHAPERAPATHTGSRTIPVGRAARRWRRQQKLMQQNQREGRQP
jgi:hypothetical protein